MRKKKEKKFHSGFKPGTSRTPGEILTTAPHMVSGHHSNTFSSISPNQRRQSKIFSAKCLVLIHSACPYKNYAHKIINLICVPA